MPKALTILKEDKRFESLLPYDRLRELGIEYISAFSGDIWTDHNKHDPGITILEVLCYALTDLGYRTRLDFEELVAPPPGGRAEDNFFTPEQILTCNPLTIADFRKMLVDIAGVRNAWLAPAEEQEVPLYTGCEAESLSYSPQPLGHIDCDSLVVVQEIPRKVRLNGLYRVYLDIDPIFAAQEDPCGAVGSRVGEIVEEVKARLHRHRNLCEDFIDVEVLKDEEIGVCADIELKPDANPETVLEKIYDAIENFLSPRLAFYSLRQMLGKGKSIEEIFEGRPYTPAYPGAENRFSHGFVDIEELEKKELPTTLYASDFYRVIMEVEGVRAINSLALSNFLAGNALTFGEEWILHLTRGHRPVFAPQRSVFKFYKGVLRLPVADKNRIIERFRKRLSDFQKSRYDASLLDQAIPYGTWRNDLEDYLSIQREFPLVYRIGERQMPETAPVERKVQALQLKGYLAFFDQLLANYLSQLSNIRQLFSLSHTADDRRATYFSQRVDSMPDADRIFRYYQDADAAQASGDAMAEAVVTYTHPSERDLAMRQLTNLFRNVTAEQERELVETVEDDAGRFRFFIKGANREHALRSKTDYPSEREARRAAQTVLFLGIFDEGYKRVNWPGISAYTFNIVDNPPDYQEFLTSIGEDNSLFLQRRDRFLNHLLARFGEQFTEYSLLMYALNQQAVDQEKIIRDKARFLSNYPDIGRNRGKGFDYTWRERIWDASENVSGTERRVAGLMGLENWERRTLNHFEVNLRQTECVLYIADHRGTVLLETCDSFPKEDVEEAKAKLRELLCNHSLRPYMPTDCDIESIYSLYLVDLEGKPFATFPKTFPNKAARDAYRLCIHDYFCPLDNAKLILRILSQDEGFYFILTADDDKTVLLKSSRSWPTEWEACQAWIEFVPLARDPDNFVELTGNFTGGRYSFGVEKTLPDGSREEIARHPTGYSSQNKRWLKKKEVIDYIRGKCLDFAIRQTPPLYSWSFLDEDGTLLLSGVHRFKSPEQAEAAWQSFRPLGLGENNYEIMPHPQGGFQIIVQKEEGLVVARSPILADLAGAIQTRDRTLALLRTYNPHAPQPALSRSEISTHSGSFYFVVFDESGAVGLLGKQLFPSPQEAECAFYHFAALAADRDNYREVVEEGTCLCSFEVFETDQILATHPHFYLKVEMETQRDQLIAWIEENYLHFALPELEDSWHFVIGWLSCEGVCEPLFIEIGEHDSYQDAKTAGEALLEECKNLTVAPLLGDEGYTFALLLDGVAVATHPVFYATASERDKVMADARNFMEHFCKIKNGEDEQELILKKVRYPVCGNKAAKHVLLSGFRLAKSDSPIAIHPKTYNTRQERDEIKEKLYDKARCGELEYTELCLKGGRIIHKEGGKYHYELWSNRPAGLLLWRSVEEFNSAEEAVEAFGKNWLKIISLSETASNYALPTADFPWLSLSLDGQALAFVPEDLPDSAEQIEARDDRIEFARLYPILAKHDGYAFRLTDLDNNALFWESGQRFDSTEEAWIRFFDFMKLLTYRPNYRCTNNNQACLFRLELREIMLESLQTFANEFVVETLATSTATFPSEEEARNQLANIRTSTLQEAPGRRPSNLSPYLGTAGSNRFSFRLPDSQSQRDLWKSPGFLSVEDASDAFGRFLQLVKTEDAYRIVPAGNTGQFAIAIQRVFPADGDTGSLNEEKQYVACPVVEDPASVEVNGVTVKAAAYCTPKGPGDDEVRICPEAWTKGLQNFLIYATEAANYYPYIDVKETCMYSFRVVTDKYRVARNTRETHTPAAREELRCWLYNQSRCAKAPIVQVPGAQIMEMEGLCHYYLEGDSPKVAWNGLEPAPDDAAAGEKYKQEFLLIICHGKTLANYEIVTDEVDGQPVFRIRLNNGQGADWVESEQYYLSEEAAQAVINYSVHYCREWYGHFKSNPGRRLPFSVFGEDPEFRYRFSFPDILWRSYEGFQTAALAAQAYTEQLLALFSYAQELDFYQLLRFQTGDVMEYQIGLTDRNNVLIAVSSERFLEPAAWNAAILERILHARRFPYYEYKGKYGFQCFSMEDPPGVAPPEPGDCPPIIGQIDVTLQGEVIWESIHEYDSLDEAICVFEVFYGTLLKDISNYQRVQFEDCNLFGIEVTHPGEALAAHPRGYPTYRAVLAAMERTRACVNEEGFHLVEHILLRPREGAGDLYSLQFLRQEPLDDDFEPCETPLMRQVPYLLTSRQHADWQSAEEACEQFIQQLEARLSKLEGPIAEHGKSLKQFLVQQGMPGASLDAFLALLAEKPEGVELREYLKAEERIFLFNRAEGTEPDALMPNCPDCCHAEALPSGEPSADACADPKALLLESMKNCGAPDETRAPSDGPAPGATWYIPGADPYSFWATIVLPYWPERFQNINFRRFFEDTLRREFPAHVAIRICWLDPKQMLHFEKYYRDWLEAMSGEENCNLKQARACLIDLLFDIKTVYPPARLQGDDCAPGGGEANAVLLDYTQLG